MKVLSVDGLSKLISLMKEDFVESSSLSTVATSGSYNDLTNKPTIPEGLPSQSGNSGKFLTTDGSSASWGTTLNDTLSLILPDSGTDHTYRAKRGNSCFIIRQSGSSNNVSADLCLGISSQGLEWADAIHLKFEYDRTTSNDRKGYFYPYGNGFESAFLGESYHKWTSIYATKLNNGGDISIPTSSGTLALTSQIPTIATTSTAGLVKPDGTTITITNDGTITAVGGGGSSLPDQTGQSGKYLTTNGTTASWATVSSGSEEDNLSITKNSSDKIQTIGVINQNATSTAIKTWSGTLAQYNNIETHSNDCLYYITDDTEESSKVDDRFTRGIAKVFPSTMWEYDNDSHTLTIKAGSKVFYPDGKNDAQVLQIHEGTITSDITYTPSDMSGNEEYIVYNITQERLEHIPVQNTRTTSDGTTDVSPCIAYNNTDNYIKKTTDTGATWSTDKYSFPIMAVIPTSGQIQHIKKVFNSCSSIGTTAYFRAGYTLRFPNGYDKETNLPTFIETYLKSHRLCEMTGNFSLYAELDTDDLETQFVSQCNNALVFQQEQMPDYRNTELWYNPDANFWFYTTDGGNTWQKCYLCFLTNQNHLGSGFINSFNPIGNATALTTNDMRLINHWNFPSSWRTNITPTSGSIYTAPGDGWFYLSVSRADGTQDAYASITGWQTNYCVTSCCPAIGDTSSTQAAVIMPVSTGCSVIMNFSGTVSACSFYYANGSYIVW